MAVIPTPPIILKVTPVLPTIIIPEFPAGIEHDTTLGRDAEDSHPMGAVTGLLEKIAFLENSTPLLNVRYFRNTTITFNGQTYYNVIADKGGETDINLTGSVTGTTTATANTVLQFATIEIPFGYNYSVRDLTLTIQAYKNNTTRVVNLFADIYVVNSAGEIVSDTTRSSAVVLSTDKEEFTLYMPLAEVFEAVAGQRIIIKFRGYQTGVGLAATATLCIEGTSLSRWTFTTLNELSKFWENDLDESTSEVLIIKPQNEAKILTRDIHDIGTLVAKNVWIDAQIEYDNSGNVVRIMFT